MAAKLDGIGQVLFNLENGVSRDVVRGVTN